MIAADTNVLVRFITADDPVQSPRAKQLLQGSEPVFVLKTVLLEVERVLRSVYKMAPLNITQSIRRVLGLASIEVESPDEVESALRLHETGFDFADAIHFIGMPEGARLATFDAQLHRRARRAGFRNVELI